MRRFLFLLVFIWAGSAICVQASVNEGVVTIERGKSDPTVASGDHPRSPMQPPQVFIDGHTLYTQYVPFDATLEILDGSGSVVFTTFVAAYTPSVSLPTTLSGDYQIRLIEGYWYFYGWIHL